MQLKRLTRAALLTAAALILYVVELQLPPLAPIPGIKPGLANIVTTAAMFTLGPADTAAILLSRILLGSLFGGSVSALLYSLSGGLLSYLTLLLLRRFLTKKQLWAASVAASIAHNLGQMGMAVLITATPGILVYLPLLLVSGILAGLFTGLAATMVVERIH
ncbi:MAG: Gx transporter family protein [bacterium]